MPLAAGGAPFDIGNTAVLCRSCNSTKGASVDADRGGVAHMGQGLARGPEPDASEIAVARERLQQQLNDGEISIETFSRAWRGLDRPRRTAQQPPDEVRLQRARHVLSEFATLWRNPAVPDGLREEALREIFARFDVDGPESVAVHPQPNENAWLLGVVAAREQRLPTQRVMGLVGARGVAPPRLSDRRAS